MKGLTTKNKTKCPEWSLTLYSEIAHETTTKSMKS